MNLAGMGNVEWQWGAVSFLSSVAIVLTTKWHGKFSLDTNSGVQKFHVAPTPRVGGIAIFLGLLLACLFSDAPMRALLGPILLAGLPAFCFGVAEDVTKRVSVRMRLVATMASGVAAWALTGASVTHIGIGGLDALLAWLPLSVLFTAFAVGGVANAVNIIDGFNGLASGTVAICLVALGLIASGCGDTALASLCFLICAVTVGFFLVNFPFGKLFLGDGGAYLLGFILAWLAVMLPFRNPSVSPWASLLACAYPIFETVFTVIRRVWTRAHPGEPDSHHLHSLIKIAISRRYFSAWRPDMCNASVSPFSWAIAILPAAFAVYFAGNTAALLTAGALSFSVYLGMYWYVSKASKQGPGLATTVVDSGESTAPVR
ncbi:glycosyltransferase [Massilia sp. AB1]|uniref:MraY family glycosyltransferase n=1 Tax=Massilia sp. AB1 TaxID=2823371 RepID=UPI001B811F7B|nr:glycosyltransferase [Massilia sp. AB1]MBQ5939624.1 glycosyltransferase family 4 protein [Massilia sp. AB1]